MRRIMNHFFARPRTGQRGGSDQRGMSALECALVLPVFLMMVMGLVEAGNLFRSWLTVQKAAQAGARFASTGQGELEGDRMARILSETGMVLDILPDATREIAVRSWPDVVASGGGAAGDPGQPCGLVEVAVTYDYTPITPIIGAALPAVIPLAGSDRKVNEPWQLCAQ
ncbi:MAG: TadE/TadG family type IV pilus assembly protein [Desulfovibrionaceae bacterium]